MKKVEEYYNKHVKKWVEIAKRLHEAKVEDRAKLVEEFGLQDVHEIDIELIVEYFRRFDVIERDYVWEGSPANPIYKAAVDAQAFLDIYEARQRGSYVNTHYRKEEGRALSKRYMKQLI